MFEGSLKRGAGLAILGGLGLTAHAAGLAASGSRLPGVIELASAAMCAAVVSFAVTLTAPRGRNLGIALGMVGTMTGVAGALTTVLSEPGFLSNASLALAFAGVLIVGLSFPRPRPGYPRWAVYAALSGAVALIASGVLTGRYAGLAFLLPAVAWAWLGAVALGPDAVPPKAKIPPARMPKKPR
ncbi:MAG: hypothetical protein ACRCYQ_07700 [Nocardioides sp.]